ncbi:NAD-dependent epimerase/dehydratase family protein [Hymenobacter bucti]|uniref:NAD-dependent epimerase/dehydratase family protein n=1 Tax=Hymenobacter bucti TaxID=1844114 RepID=A0ABW4QSB9_9BACT
MRQSDLVATTCVIGGNGFIGRAVVNALLTQRRSVIVVGRTPLLTPLPDGVEYIVSNADNKNSSLREALSRADEVINLAYATIPQTSFQHPVDDIVLNLPEAVQLFEMAAALPIRKFLVVSSGGTVYGRASISPLTEEHPTLPLSPYGITKLAIEKYAHMYFDNRGLPAVSVRPSNAFGAGQRPYVGQGFIATAMASILDGRTVNIFGEHGTVRDYLYVVDMAEGIVAALLAGIPGEVYNIGSGIGLTNKQVLEAIAPLAAQIGLKVKTEVLPPRPFDVPVNILDSSKLQDLTGWGSKTSFATALQQTWDWYRQRTIK